MSDSRSDQEVLERDIRYLCERLSETARSADLNGIEVGLSTSRNGQWSPLLHRHLRRIIETARAERNDLLGADTIALAARVLAALPPDTRPDQIASNGMTKGEGPVTSSVKT
jgi:hypothetical protein